MLTDRPEFSLFSSTLTLGPHKSICILYQGGNTSSRRKTSESYGRYFQFQLQVRSRYGADNVQTLVVYTPGWIDHDVVNARGDRGVKG